MNTSNISSFHSWLVKFRNLKLGARLLLFGISSVLVTNLLLVGVMAWQSSQYNALAQDEFSQLADSDLEHTVKGVYNMVEAQDELVQQMVNNNLNVARLVLDSTGSLNLDEKHVKWTAINQLTQESLQVSLPKMLVGDIWFGQNTSLSIKTPVVDQIQSLVGGTATVFQRLNEQGDMLRVATNVQTAEGKRAIGTYIPVTMEDGGLNPIIAAILSGETYYGEAYVVDAWYNTAYEPILNESGRVIGMLYVGVKQQNVESLRRAILETKVGETGYVYVLGSDGNDQGSYIISDEGQRDGENIWEEQDAEGNYIVQTIINKAVILKPGETTSVRYQWQNPSEPEPRWKIAHIAYYEPWHWVIGVSAYEDELATYRRVLEDGQIRMILISGGVGLAIALVISFLSILMAGSISRPVGHLATVATQISAGNLSAEAEPAGPPEIVQVALAFNTMTSRLRDLISTLEQRVADRTRALSSVAEVGTAASSILETDKLLQQVVDLAKERFDFYHAHIYLLDATRTSLVLSSGAGAIGQQMVARGHSIPLDREQSLVARAAREKKGVTVNDVTSTPDFLPNALLPETRSELAVPMRVGDEVIGVFDVQSEIVGRFTDADIAVQTTLASQVASAVQNARSYSEIQRSQALLSEALQISRLANWEYDVDRDLFTFNDSFYAIFRTTVEKVGGYKLSSADYARLFVHPEDAPLVGSEIQKALDSRERHLKTELEHRIIFEDGEVGYIAVKINVERDGNGKILRWYGANQDVTERRRLEELNRKQAMQQQAINQITQRIQSTTTIESALQIAARELGHALGQKPTFVALGTATPAGENKVVVNE